MMRRIELWIAVVLLAAAIPVHAQEADEKKPTTQGGAASTPAAPKKAATEIPIM